MEMNFEALLQKLTEFIQKQAKTQTVIGEAFHLGEFTCVPVVRVGMGFGSGGGEGDSTKTGKGQGGGAGAGIDYGWIGHYILGALFAFRTLWLWAAYFKWAKRITKRSTNAFSHDL